VQLSANGLETICSVRYLGDELKMAKRSNV
jgi:hypothetical protein